MANEISVTIKITFAKGTLPTVSRNPSALSVDMTGTQFVAGVQSIGTVEEALDLGDMGALTLGWMYAKNLDGTNFVEIRPNTATADLIKLKAGEFCLFRLTSNTPYAIADTAACELDYLIVED